MSGYVQYKALSQGTTASTVVAPSITVSTGDALLVCASRVSNIGVNCTLTDGGVGNSYNFIGTLYESSYSLSPAPSNGATSASLASNWTGSTGTNYAAFSDGEVRQVLFTNGITGISWTGALTGTTFQAQISSGNTQLDLFLATNCAGSATTVTATAPAGTGMVAILVVEYNAVLSSFLSAYLGMQMNDQVGAGSGANAVTSGVLPITVTPCLLVGLTIDYTGTDALSSGTSPILFTSRSIPNFTPNNPVQNALLEDYQINSSGSYAATFTSAGFGMGTVVIGLALTGASSTSPTPIYYQRRVLYFI